MPYVVTRPYLETAPNSTLPVARMRYVGEVLDTAPRRLIIDGTVVDKAVFDNLNKADLTVTINSGLNKVDWSLAGLGRKYTEGIISFGDGTSEVFTSASASGSHTYATHGTYDLHVQLNSGVTADKTISFTTS